SRIPRIPASRCEALRSLNTHRGAIAVFPLLPPVACPPASETRRLGERVDPALQAARLPGHQLWLAKGVGQQRDSLIGGYQSNGEVARIASAHLLELPLRPVDRDLHECRGIACKRVRSLVQF